MQLITKNFDFLMFSFRGCSLIEASAGTGKTYLIVMLYLRLLLGIGNEDYLQSLTVENILVVTFTKIAVEELRERIRINLREFRLSCIVGYSTNPFFSDLLKKIDNVHSACQILLAAEHTIDRASIFTIHGFCQHILNMYPIELHSIFKYNILEHEDHLLEIACNDFWRSYFYSLPTEIVNIITGYWNSPKDLLKDVYPYLYNLNINIRPLLQGDFITCHKHIIAYIDHVKKIWIAEKSKLLEFMYGNHFLNRRVYNTNNILRWFKAINLWAQNITVDYSAPSALQRFKYSVMIRYIITGHNHQILQYHLFELIDILFEKIVSLKQLILSTAIHKIRKNISSLKKQSSEISFNDLISLLDDGLHVHDKNRKLLQSIQKNYPIAIVDEFQDTDLQQYRIFHTLYSSTFQSKYGLLLIGDPKQSIYSFRGADIFSYLLARKHVDFHYTLNINWRASKGMVNAINKLFHSDTSFSPFVFHEIPFITMHAAKNNNKLRLVIKNESYPSLCFYLPSRNQLTVHEHQKIMAFHCAIIIRDLLRGASCGEVWLKNMHDKKLLQSSDIVILVRNGCEGRLISSVLNQFNISNIYLSNQENIFGTLEAFDLLLILQAVLSPEDNNILRCALITNIIGYNAQKIEFVNQNDDDWRKEVNNFTDYHLFWKKYGVQAMLQEIIFRRRISQYLLTTQDGKIRLVNILHLAEILQKHSINLHDDRSLVNWLRMKINLCNNLSANDQLLRLTGDIKLVRIITIHKSKGLEFPLVFLPFISTLRNKEYPLFHDRKNYRMYLDLSNTSKSIDLSDEERLSEDLRLLYVAITRAIYHCFIGIGAIFFKKNIKKKECCNDLHRTALGYLVQHGIPGDFCFLEQCLMKLVQSAQGDIMLNYISNNQNQENYKLLPNITDSNLTKKKLTARSWKIQVNTKYTVTSYSELYRFNTSFSSEQPINKQKIIHTSNNNNKNNILFSPHVFPQGREAGTFLHYIFKKCDFKKNEINDEWLSLQLMKHGIDLMWLPILQIWINVIISVPLNNENFMLSQLLFTDYRTEFEFYLSVSSLVSAKKFDKICKDYDPISRLSPVLTFPDILGMIHGFIDLVFRWKGKYYLLDYKSNWLGNEYNDYSALSIKNAMAFHHYALQYQIYTLALHRFLRHKLISYSYEKDFGGVYYLFVRGIDLMRPGSGIYFCLPNPRLISELDKLLSVCE